ncbi:hypothetical protein L4X63_01850 [Geomonas sp. Red32]|uniref:laminin B domain-containing protein n=1 Tax=Geomonas sp. Red32 TaxID=2912856 RepID=UPI00202CD99F|nr:laminin B domain-containing protein [Geomonas sp. Red32]MCM0080321.1 hypothetical protein [Geomonas sp. Red32]
MTMAWKKALVIMGAMTVLVWGGCGGGGSNGNGSGNVNTPASYHVSGAVTLNGAGLDGVSIGTSGATVTTDSSGAYTIAGLSNGSYAVTPAKAGYFFSPASIPVTVQGGDLTGQNFTATPDSANVVASSFTSGDEGWRVVGDAQGTSTLPTYRATGGNPGGYLEAVDNADGITWYWVAPAQFLGDDSSSYGKSLEFDLRQSTTQSQYADHDIILVGGGITLTYDTLPHPQTTWTHYNIQLTESGWKNGTADATRADFQTVLAAVTSLTIRGEFVVGPDTGGLDNVRLFK